MPDELGNWGPQLRKGVLELAVLGLLATQERYGSSLVDDLAGRPGLAVTPGTVYPLLSRLAKAGLVTTTWRESPVGPPRKYYRLSAAGRRRLDAMAEEFAAVSAALRDILKEES
ncbi:MAG: PadR family transcriptional regulator [Micropruina sp.]|uniref:PadR family transcriptional regulator n=1 Tax=Micropruina sp. TaxID=2737536 RepID=UPI0039E22A58